MISNLFIFIDMNRKLTSEEFMKMLQLEYLSYKVRSLIVEKPEFVKMNEDIAKMKKEKIQELSFKSGLRNIFQSDQEFYDFYHNHFFNSWTTKNLLLHIDMQYNSDSSKKDGQFFYDKFFLYKKGTPVIYQNEVYTVVRNNAREATVILSLGNNHFIKVEYRDILRKDVVTAFGGRLI